MVTVRSLGRAKPGAIKIIGGQENFDQRSMLELRKHMLEAECSPGVADDDSSGGG